ncbi:MAG: SHOCT domain-containing protein [Polaromonas sp.]|nr:SHOCT domain-containing protein [Polaromonas sp.]
MKNKLFTIASQWGSKAGDALSSAAVRAAAMTQDHQPDAQAMALAKERLQRMAAATVVEVKDAMKSDLAKDAAKGAAIGAVVAVPVPVIGSVMGAVVGAGVGVYANLTRAKTDAPKTGAPVQAQSSAQAAPATGMYDELLQLNDLLQKGILTQAEFDEQKARVLDNY